MLLSNDEFPSWNIHYSTTMLLTLSDSHPSWKETSRKSYLPNRLETSTFQNSERSLTARDAYGRSPSSSGSHRSVMSVDPIEVFWWRPAILLWTRQDRIVSNWCLGTDLKMQIYYEFCWASGKQIVSFIHLTKLLHWRDYIKTCERVNITLLILVTLPKNIRSRKMTENLNDHLYDFCDGDRLVDSTAHGLQYNLRCSLILHDQHTKMRTGKTIKPSTNQQGILQSACYHCNTITISLRECQDLATRQPRGISRYDIFSNLKRRLAISA